MYGNLAQIVNFENSGDNFENLKEKWGKVFKKWNLKVFGGKHSGTIM